MAISTNSYFSNSIIGTPQVGADIDLYGADTSPKYAVGFGFTRADGTKYRYCHFGAVSAVGKLVSTDVDEVQQLYIDNARMVALVADLVKKPGETLGPNVVGSNYIQVTLTTSADQFAGGYVSITSGTGIGFTYRVRGCTATGTPNSTDAYLELYDKIQVAVDSNTGLQIFGSPYADLEIVDDSDDRIVAGVTVTNISAASYGWVQTRGIGTVLQGATLPVQGDSVYVSSNTDGAVVGTVLTATSTSQKFTRVGTCIMPATATYYSCVLIELE
jgi:hypothetical protein